MDEYISMNAWNCENRLEAVKEIIDQLIKSGEKPRKGRHRLIMSGLYFLSSQLEIKTKAQKIARKTWGLK